MVCYCKKCGFIGAIVLNKKCKNCGMKLTTLSEAMKQKYNIFTDDWSSFVFGIHKLNSEDEKKCKVDELLTRKNNFIINEVANNPLFSNEEYEKQVQKDREFFNDFYNISQYQKNKQVENSTHNTGLHYCKKCGRRVIINPYNGVIDETCDYCKSEVYPVPKEYLNKDVDCFFKDKETEEYFVENFIKTAPEFDEYLFNHRDNDLQQRWAKTEAALEHGKAVLEGRDKGNEFGVECPYCHATNVNKITNTSKAMHTVLFGIFSMGRNSKNFHCNNCNSDF